MHQHKLEEFFWEVKFCAPVEANFSCTPCMEGERLERGGIVGSWREPSGHVNFGTPAGVYSTDFGCLDINGKMETIGTPVIDKARGVLYVVASTAPAPSPGP
jgi:hypothetical protein